jgi:IS5 family transposase
MTWLASHDGSPGRPVVFSDAAIQFCLTIKVLFKLPLRQATGMVASLLKLAGLDWAVPDYTTLCRKQKTLAVQIPYRRADGPLNLLIDSTGIKFLGDGEWQARKHGIQGRRQWRKVHLAMDTATSDIRAVEFTASSHDDSPVLPELLGQIPDDEEVATVTADGAYDTRRCHTAIIDRQATAIIPIRKNGRPWKEDCPAAIARNETLRATRGNPPIFNGVHS